MTTPTGPRRGPTWLRVREAFDLALDLPLDGLYEVLQARFDEDVVAEAMALRRHHEVAEGFLEPAEGNAMQVHVRQLAKALPSERMERIELRKGRKIANRYEIQREIGRGGSAIVYGARDELTGRTVAVKIVPHWGANRPSPIQGEAAAMRFLRPAGVAHVVDDGSEDNFTFLVMELVRGRPFPGGGRDRTYVWSELEPVTRGLLEALARIHWAGIVHCDLKPENVLIDRAGRVVILDLGIARDPGADRGVLRGQAMAGTPRYISPEQIQGQPGAVRSDLYAVGVMLYEALAGCDPHEARTAAEVFCFRPHVPPPPLEGVVTGVPAHVSDTINQMLSTDPQARPPSAAEALRMLLGKEPVRHGAPFLGSRALIDSIVDSARQGRSIDVGGTPGSGRSRSLHEARQHLKAAGFEVRRLRASKSPYGSLAGVVEKTSIQGGSAAEARAWVQDAVAGLLESRLVLLADDFPGLDRGTREVLAGCRASGCIVFVHDVPAAGASPRPLEACDLEPLFLGHNRIHHIPEDAARQLHRLSRGNPADAFAELDAWVRAGLARREGDQYGLERPALESIAAGTHLRSRSAVGVPEDIDPSARELLAALDLAGEYASASFLAAILEREGWLVEEQIEDLVAHGLVAREVDGALCSLRPALGAGDLSREQRRGLHAATAKALPAHEPRRIFHLFAAGADQAVSREAVQVAADEIEEGRIDRAIALLRAGLGALRGRPDPELEDAYLDVLLLASILRGTTGVFDRFLYDLSRVQTDASPKRRRLANIARAGEHAQKGATQPALNVLPEFAEADTATERRCLLSVLMFATRQLPSADRSAGIDRAAEHAGADPQLRRIVMSTRAWHHYADGEYGLAARIHRDIAQKIRNPAVRLASLLNAASAALEAGQLDRAERWARTGLELAAELRHGHQEARAEWILRFIAYRLDSAGEPDLELVSAAKILNVPNLRALINLIEAAAAWRLGRRLVSRELAGRAAELWDAMGAKAKWLVADSLVAASGRECSRADLAAAYEDVRDCRVAAHAVQAAYLYSCTSVEFKPRFLALARTRAAELPPSNWAQRLEVVSIAEAVK